MSFDPHRPGASRFDGLVAVLARAWIVITLGGPLAIYALLDPAAFAWLQRWLDWLL